MKGKAEEQQRRGRVCWSLDQRIWMASQREMPLEHGSITPLGNQADSNEFLARRVLYEVTNEQYSQKAGKKYKPKETEGYGGMGSLADELEKVKVGLPRLKTVSSSRALSHTQGERSQPECPPRHWRLRCKDEGGRERFFLIREII